jgi:hypothetical protein
LTDGQLKLMPVEETSQFSTAPLPLTRDGQKIRILSEEYTAQLSRPLEKERIRGLGHLILGGGQNIHSVKA